MLRTLCWMYLAVIFVPDVESKQILAVAGPFKIIIRKLESCIDQITYRDKWTYYIRDSRAKHNNAIKFSGNHTVPFDFDNTSGGRIKLSAWSAIGGWHEHAHVLGCKEVCRCLEFVAPNQWQNYQTAIFGEKISCPHPAGIYRFDNITVELSNIAIKQFIYGRWRADAQLLLKTGEIGGCLRAYADTVPI